MAKPVKNYHINNISDNKRYSWFEVIAINHTRFVADITDIEGIDSVANTDDRLTVWCSPLYAKQDIINEVITLLDSVFAPVPDTFTNEFDEAL